MTNNIFYNTNRLYKILLSLRYYFNLEVCYLRLSVKYGMIPI